MLNFIDLIVFLLLLFFVWQGYQTGFVGGLLNLLTTIISFLLASFLYPYLGNFLSQQFDLSENLALVVGFFLILLFSEIILSFVSNFIFKNTITPLHQRFKAFVKLDQILGVIPSLIIGIILISLFLLLPLVLPVSNGLRNNVSDSWWGSRVLTRAINLQPKIEGYLNRLPYQNLIYLLTPTPDSEESIQLSIPKDIEFKVDEIAEEQMLDLVNQERTRVGLKSVKADSQMLEVARDHCLDMFQRSYFSHYTPEGKSPFDRMKEAGIDYTFAGENLAFAPSVKIAHQGLMNSPGHRENILREEFGRLGVGVIDGGFAGKMFCQEFRN